MYKCYLASIRDVIQYTSAKLGLVDYDSVVVVCKVK